MLYTRTLLGLIRNSNGLFEFHTQHESFLRSNLLQNG
jgi:hypothetical protein